ncbi:MAG: glycosyltransferase family 4 protein, partial [Fuerstiella sp.]|nr:glycosyltransferase family 4 protein [Fuerstiella sp.]
MHSAETAPQPFGAFRFFLHQLRSCDELMVCSEWAKGVIQDHGLGNTIHVVPLGVDSSVFLPANRVPKDKTVFFNCGKWEVRKGHDILIQAFRLAYEKNPNIALWMMCHNPFNDPAENRKWEHLYDHPGVELIPRAETQEGVYNMMARADCGIFPSRGEGWNLELLEMMSVGRHVIATIKQQMANTDADLLIHGGVNRPETDPQSTPVSECP